MFARFTEAGFIHCKVKLKEILIYSSNYYPSTALYREGEILIKGLYFKSKISSSTLTFFPITVGLCFVLFCFSTCPHIIHLRRSEPSEQEYELGLTQLLPQEQFLPFYC